LNAVAYGLFAFVAFVGAVGFGTFAYASRPSRIAAARQAGESEEAIQRGLALIRRTRNLFATVVIIAVLGAIWFHLAS
jgi:hypothetical protein